MFCTLTYRMMAVESVSPSSSTTSVCVDTDGQEKTRTFNPTLFIQPLLQRRGFQEQLL